jgi:hypothetical protein
MGRSAVTGLPEGLLRYFELRERHRADEIAALLARLTAREQALVREAAVMGFVRGAIFASGGRRLPEIPRDSRIVAEAVGACLSMPETYPTLSGWEPTDA